MTHCSLLGRWLKRYCSVRQEGIINRRGKCTGYSKLPFETGDDVIVKGTIRRVDTYIGEVLNMVSVTFTDLHLLLSSATEIYHSRRDAWEAPARPVAGAQYLV